ncbi:hypothetical protein L6259_03145 [Candidatus Parcubacteria bacterium]|nr:hypothetical protein [Patescibacteria group bacterium]MCG2694235.1 hypothetical protein [Candidatus Parcubacteria bacterium]
MKKSKKEFVNAFRKKVEKYWYVIAIALLALGVYLIYLSTTIQGGAE